MVGIGADGKAIIEQDVVTTDNPEYCLPDYVRHPDYRLPQPPKPDYTYHGTRVELVEPHFNEDCVLTVTPELNAYKRSQFERYGVGYVDKRVISL
jgi:hypothetical protein